MCYRAAPGGDLLVTLPRILLSNAGRNCQDDRQTTLQQWPSCKFEPYRPLECSFTDLKADIWGTDEGSACDSKLGQGRGISNYLEADEGPYTALLLNRLTPAVGPEMRPKAQGSNKNYSLKVLNCLVWTHFGDYGPTIDNYTHLKSLKSRILNMLLRGARGYTQQANIALVELGLSGPRQPVLNP